MSKRLGPGFDASRALEERLRRSAERLAAQCDDPELAGVLSWIGRRRRARGEVSRAVDAVRAQVSESASPLSQSGRVHSCEDVSADVRVMRVGKPPGFDFQPGQHVKVGLVDRGSNPYTIASPPSAPHLEFCFERVPSGKLTPSLFRLVPGDRVELGSRAKGTFLLDERASIHLMIATVTGIAPFMSMLRERLPAASRTAPFIVLHGASYADELPYRDVLESMAAEHASVLSYIPTVSRPAERRSAGWSGQTGRVDALALRYAQELGFDRNAVRVYACGNPGMVRTVRDTLGEAGYAVSAEVFD